jgi:hypothetical protein
MTPAPRYQYKIGSGYNLPLGSLTNVELIADYNGKYLYPPQGFPTYLPGLPKIRLNGIEFESGFSSVEWLWTGNGGQGIITYGGARKLRTDYFNGQWSGSLTIYTKTANETSYELYNAVGTMRKFPESAPNFKIFTGFGIRMSRLVAL